MLSQGIICLSSTYYGRLDTGVCHCYCYCYDISFWSYQQCSTTATSYHSIISLPAYTTWNIWLLLVVIVVVVPTIVSSEWDSCCDYYSHRHFCIDRVPFQMSVVELSFLIPSDIGRYAMTALTMSLDYSTITFGSHPEYLWLKQSLSWFFVLDLVVVGVRPKRWMMTIIMIAMSVAICRVQSWSMFLRQATWWNDFVIKCNKSFNALLLVSLFCCDDTAVRDSWQEICIQRYCFHKSF